MIIRRIVLDEVKVPARPDSINSPETDYALHKLPQGATKGWSQQFDEVSKTMIQVFLDNGVVGLGETYRGCSPDTLQLIASALIGNDLGKLNLQDLPFPSGRVYDGFECALVDAVAKSHNIPLYQWLGGAYRDTVSCAFWTGHRTTIDAVRKAEQACAQGFNNIKFKCSLSDPVVEWCQEIFDVCGKNLCVILDPNERFILPTHAERIARDLAEIGNVLYLEDPIPRWDYESWVYLRGKSHVPLSMHISLPYAEMGQMPYDAARAARSMANDYFNFNGGIYAYQKLTSLSDLFGIPYSHGSEIDLGILEASYVHKSAAAAGNTLPSDIFGRLVREHDLLKTPLEISNGSITVPQGPGLGVQLDLAALSHYSLSHWETKA
jgi:muconate cycloisomerase